MQLFSVTGDTAVERVVHHPTRCDRGLYAVLVVAYIGLFLSHVLTFPSACQSQREALH